MTLLHTKCTRFGSCDFREEDFSCVSIISLWQIMKPSGRRLYEHQGLTGLIKINKENITLLHTKFESSGPCGLREDFYVFPIISLWQIMTPPGRGLYGPRGRFYKENYYTLLRTKYEHSGPRGF